MWQRIEKGTVQLKVPPISDQMDVGEILDTLLARQRVTLERLSILLADGTMKNIALSNISRMAGQFDVTGAPADVALLRQCLQERDWGEIEPHRSKIWVALCWLFSRKQLLSSSSPSPPEPESP